LSLRPESPQHLRSQRRDLLLARLGHLPSRFFGPLPVPSDAACVGQAGLLADCATFHAATASY